MKSSSSPDRKLGGKIIYALIFCAALPAFLLFWGWRLNTLLPQLPPVHGYEIPSCMSLIAGFILMLIGMRSLWKDGKGLPMNAFPPTQLVQTGIYRWIPHPIYTGSVLFLAGTFGLLHLSAGLWVILPIFITAIIALLWGYEIPDLKKRFSQNYHVSQIQIPCLTSLPPTLGQRLNAYAYVLLPWLVIYLYLAALLPASTMLDTSLPFEKNWAVQPWAIIPYMGAYLWVGLAPFAAKKQTSLRHFIFTGILGMVIGFTCFILLPLKADPRSFGQYQQSLSFLESLILWQQTADTPACAFPSFHVFWALAAASLWRERIHKWLSWSIATLICISCLLVSMHSLIDVIAGASLFALSSQYTWLYRKTLHITQHFANRWREWRIGSHQPFRIINHGFYAGLGAFFGILLATIFYPDVSSWWLFFIGLTCMLGGCLWGQWLEASSVLMRPFGYYGSVLGGAVGLLLAFTLQGADFFWQLCAALATIAPLVQALGRLRCLIQGCCHGRTSSLYHGICYHQPQNRVVRIAKLAHTPVYPTQLYSIVGNLMLLVILLGLTIYHAPASLIVGMYLMLSACARFIEEHYRGEPQTLTYANLAIYQWLALGFLIAGAMLTMFPSSQVTGISAMTLNSLNALAPAGLLGLIAWFAMGMDWPESNRMLSRLT